MLVPAAFTARMLLKISCTTMGARPSEGSSMQSRRGSDMRARESASICCSPPESVPAGCEARSRRRGKLPMARSISASTFFRSLRYLKPPISRFSRTVSAGNTRRPSGTSAMPAAVRACAGSRVTSTPSKRIFPFLEDIEPATPRMVVLLPAPLAPIRVTISPSATWNDTPRTAACRSRLSTSSSNLASEIGLDHARVRLHLARRAFDEPQAMVHDEYALRHVHHQVHVVLDHDDGHVSFLVDVLQSFQKEPHLRGVQAGGRLVQHEELRSRGERPGDLEHALLAVRKCPRPIRCPVSKTDKRQELHRFVAEPPRRTGKEALPQRQGLVDVESREDVLEQGELLEEADLLEGAGDAEADARVRGQAHEIRFLQLKKT